MIRRTRSPSTRPMASIPRSTRCIRGRTKGPTPAASWGWDSRGSWPTASPTTIRSTTRSPSPPTGRPAGSARGSANTQQQAFQFGVNVGGRTQPYSAVTSLVAPFNGLTPQAGQEMGFYLGTGDQDNYLQIVVTGNGGGSIETLLEVGGAA